MLREKKRKENGKKKNGERKNGNRMTSMEKDQRTIIIGFVVSRVLDGLERLSSS